MKANKTMEHTQLIVQVCFIDELHLKFSSRPFQVTNQLKGRFPIKPQLIERRIRSLIESEYISQPENNTYVVCKTNHCFF
jgi:hypothetical protein